MANGDGWFSLEHIWQWINGILATVATAATSAAIWVYRRYRQHVPMLVSSHSYYKLLRKVHAVSRILDHEEKLNKILAIVEAQEGGQKNARAIERVSERVTEMSQEVDALNDEVEKLGRLVVEIKHAVQTQCNALATMTAENNRMRDIFERLMPYTMRERPGQ